LYETPFCTKDEGKKGNKSEEIIFCHKGGNFKLKIVFKYKKRGFLIRILLRRY